MILGMSWATFTTIHVIISLIAIAAGLVVMFGMLGSRPMPTLSAIFLALTILTSVSGFFFLPLRLEKLTPGQIIGIFSLVLLAIACVALYGMRLTGPWRWIYALTALISLYLNVFVLVLQSFLKVPALHALAPSVPPAEPAFAIVQGAVLAFFVVMIVAVVRRFRPAGFPRISFLRQPIRLRRDETILRRLSRPKPAHTRARS